ncbi:MAG: EVE domain-containing protein [Kofleriaceae bacterium]
MAKAAPKHWLMKTEPDTFGIDDLARVRVEPWTGVRNYQARNLMRDEMRLGDEVLFYHSNATPPGVAGLARIHRTGVVDETQFEPSSPYYDPKARRDAPTWICVDVAYVETLPRLLPLDELRQLPGLEDMPLLRRGMRLSVQPVTAAQFKRIVAAARRAAPTPTPPARATPKAARPRRR